MPELGLFAEKFVLWHPLRYKPPPFLMRHAFHASVFLVLCCITFGCAVPAEEIEPTTTALPRSTPEAQGVSSAQIHAFLDAVDAQWHEENPAVEMHSVMIVRNGHVIAEGWWQPYGPDYQHMLFSLSKSFTSTAVGLAIEEGHFTLDDPVMRFFPGDMPESIDDRLGSMTVRHLLTMSVGHEQDSRTTENWVQTFLGQPIVHEPGSTFRYNSMATFMLSALVQQVTGETVTSYLTPRLFEPLGIENPVWVQNVRGIDVGGWGLNITTEDIATFGLLYLQNGQWNGEQLIPEAWVHEATGHQIVTRAADVSEEDAADNDWAQGYGYKFWQTTHGAYRGDGAFGQFALVLPELDVVIAMTAGSRDMQAELHLIWDHLLPAFQETPLPANASAHAALQERLSNLTLLKNTAAATSPLAESISGQTYTLETNDMGLEALTLDLTETTCALTLTFTDGPTTMPCGLGEWARSDHPQLLRQQTAGIFAPTSSAIAAAGYWTTPTTFEIIAQFYETPFSDTITLDFADDAVTFSRQRNVGGLSWTAQGKRQP